VLLGAAFIHCRLPTPKIDEGIRSTTKEQKISAFLVGILPIGVTSYQKGHHPMKHWQSLSLLVACAINMSTCSATPTLSFNKPPLLLLHVDDELPCSMPGTKSRPVSLSCTRRITAKPFSFSASCSAASSGPAKKRRTEKPLRLKSATDPLAWG